jgi:hypothetical protein
VRSDSGKGRRLIALLSVALLASSCGGTEVLDTADVAAQLSDTLTTQLSTNIAVDCPGEVPLEEGESFTCTATGSEETFDVVVTETDSEGSVAAKRASLNMGAIEEQIAKSLETLGGIDIGVTCPDDAEVGEGKMFECLATSERGELTFVVQQTDDFGNVTFRPKPEKGK